MEQHAIQQPAVLVVAGTSDGREAAETLARRGIPVVATVATDWAAELLAGSGVSVRVGRLDAAGFKQLIQSEHIGAVIDCSHPYAQLVSEAVQSVCADMGVLCSRYRRPPGSHPAANDVIAAGSPEQAAAAAAVLLKSLSPEQTVFLTTGTKDLAIYASCLPPDRLVPRVLPVVASLERCQACGIRTDRIVAMQGPFDRALNEALFRAFRAGVVITKDGGSRGGFKEKIEASQAVGAACIVVERPPDAAEQVPVYEQLDELISAVATAYQVQATEEISI